MPYWLTQMLYLVAAILFIVGLKRMNSPATARGGNLISFAGMLLAMAVTLLDQAIVSFGVIVAGVAVGTGLGLWQAYSVRMTAMPQMVALLNGWGGGASMVVSAAEFLRAYQANALIPTQTGAVMQAGLLVGGVTLTGSLIAFAKLQEWMSGRPITFAGQNLFNALVFLGIVGLGWWQVSTEVPLLVPFYLLCALSLVLGVLLVIPIGGADMPVVISLLNSYSGIAAGMTGFVINNEVLIIAGALVGSSGIILSQVMCKAMNRSLANVLFGAFGAQAAVGGGGKTAAGLSVKSIGPEDLGVQVAYANKMIVVPGYGMAVAQAQHQVRELADLVEKRGGTVKYAIHPVAGRMPGALRPLI
jgi:proton-translocating NAD(P)+ transhydrogenase subunit beta